MSIRKALTNPSPPSPRVEPPKAAERISLGGCQERPLEYYPSTILHPNSILRQPSAVRQHRRITKLKEIQTTSGEPATLHTRPESMRKPYARRRGQSAGATVGGLKAITADVDCFEERITLRQSQHVKRALELPCVFPSPENETTLLFRGPSAKRVVPRSVALAHLGENNQGVRPVLWEQRKKEERLQQDVLDTMALENQSDRIPPPLPTADPTIPQPIREMQLAAQNRQHQLWKLQMALQLIKRTSLYELFVRLCDYRTRLQLIVREGDFIVKALDNDMSPLQPSLVLGYHPLIWILSSGNINFSYKDLNSHYMDAGTEQESGESGADESASSLNPDPTPRSAISHYLRTPDDLAIFHLLTEMGEEEKSGVAALLDAMFAVMTKPPMRPLDMAEFRQVMVNVSTALRREISLMQIVLDRLKARVERKKSVLTKEWMHTRAEFCTTHGTQAQLEGYHVPTEYEISLLLDAYTGALEEPTTTFTGVELKMEDVEVWFRFVKNFHVTGVSVLKVEHILESVAIVMAEVSAPVGLPDAAYEIFGYNGILSKEVNIEDVNLFGCPAIKATRLPGDPVTSDDVGPISNEAGSERAKAVAAAELRADLAHSLFAIDVLGHDPLRVHHDLDFALEEIMQLLELAKAICLERRSEDQRYRQATCVGEEEKEEEMNRLHATWARETSDLLEYMWRAELRVANVHFIHSLLREHAPEMYKAFQEEHRTYLTGHPPSKKLETFTALVERYNPFPNRLVNSYLHCDVQKKYPKNFFIMAVCHESYAQLKECENIVFWVMLKHYTAAVKAHRLKMRHTNRIPQTQTIPPKSSLLIDHERIEHLTTPGYHLNEKANPLLLPHCPKAVQILSWLEKLVGLPLRSYSVSSGDAMSRNNQNSSVSMRSNSRVNPVTGKWKGKKVAEEERYGVMDCFIVTDYHRQLYEAPEHE